MLSLPFTTLRIECCQLTTLLSKANAGTSRKFSRLAKTDLGATSISSNESILNTLHPGLEKKTLTLSSRFKSSGLITTSRLLLLANNKLLMLKLSSLQTSARLSTRSSTHIGFHSSLARLLHCLLDLKPKGHVYLWRRGMLEILLVKIRTLLCPGVSSLCSTMSPEHCRSHIGTMHVPRVTAARLQGTFNLTRGISFPN